MATTHGRRFRSIRRHLTPWIFWLILASLLTGIVSNLVAIAQMLH